MAIEVPNMIQIGSTGRNSGNCLSYTISEPTRLRRISYAVFCLKKKKKKKRKERKEITKIKSKNN